MVALLQEVLLELALWDSFLQEAPIGLTCLYVLGPPVTVLSRSDEFGQAPRRFLGSGCTRWREPQEQRLRGRKWVEIGHLGSGGK